MCEHQLQQQGGAGIGLDISIQQYRQHHKFCYLIYPNTAGGCVFTTNVDSVDLAGGRYLGYA